MLVWEKKSGNRHGNNKMPEKRDADRQMTRVSKKKIQKLYKMLFFMPKCLIFVNKFGRKTKKL